MEKGFFFIKSLCRVSFLVTPILLSACGGASQNLASDSTSSTLGYPVDIPVTKVESERSTEINPVDTQEVYAEESIVELTMPDSAEEPAIDILFDEPAADETIIVESTPESVVESAITESVPQKTVVESAADMLLGDETPDPVAESVIAEPVVAPVLDSTISEPTIAESTTNTKSLPVGEAFLYWQIPTTRSDGSVLPLNEIAGYHVYSRTAGYDFKRIRTLADPLTNETTLSDLPPGTHYFFVTTYNVYGVESDQSDIVSKYIP